MKKPLIPMCFGVRGFYLAEQTFFSKRLLSDFQFDILVTKLLE